MNRILKHIPRNTVQLTHQRGIFQWINIIFNAIDEDRRKLVGPDRSCAEWILRNGGAVKWVNETNFLRDYNKLPKEDVRLQLEEVDATKSTIMHYGFGHFNGCKHITKIKFHDCTYLENSALKYLDALKDSLRILEVSNCPNITEKGLQHLSVLNNLENLTISDLPYLKDQLIIESLNRALPTCHIHFRK